MLLLEQDIIRKRWVDKNLIEFKAGKNKEYKVEEIWNSTVYAKKSVADHLLSFYYLIF